MWRKNHISSWQNIVATVICDIEEWNLCKQRSKGSIRHKRVSFSSVGVREGLHASVPTAMCWGKPSNNNLPEDPNKTWSVPSTVPARSAHYSLLPSLTTRNPRLPPSWNHLKATQSANQILTLNVTNRSINTKKTLKATHSTFTQSVNLNGKKIPKKAKWAWRRWEVNVRIKGKYVHLNRFYKPRDGVWSWKNAEKGRQNVEETTGRNWTIAATAHLHLLQPIFFCFSQMS